MIINTKTGLQIQGELVREPEVRQAGSKRVLKLCLRYGWEDAAEPGGRRSGKIMDVDVWHDIEALDGMLHKGDSVAVYADRAKSREYSGKIYYSVDDTGITPSAAVVLGWMQQAIDMMGAEMDSRLADVWATLEKWKPVLEKLDGWQDAGGKGAPFAAGGPQAEQTPMQHPADPSKAAQNIPTGHELYPGEALCDYIPPAKGAKRAAHAVSAGPPIDDTEDLPF